MSLLLIVLVGYALVGGCVGALVCTQFWQRRVLGCGERIPLGDAPAIVIFCIALWPFVLLLGIAGDDI